MTQVTLETLVPVVRALAASAFRRESPFHLSACGVCGAPTFQYPCPSCQSWCDYSDSGAERQRQRDSAAKSGVGSRESFVRRIDLAGGIGPWYFSQFRRTVAYTNGSGFTQEVDPAVERAASISWPDPGEVWDAVKTGSHKFPEKDFYSEAYRHREARALEEFGEVGLTRVKAVNGGQHRWPENCDEARDFVAKLGEEYLASVGLVDDPTSPPPGP